MEDGVAVIRAHLGIAAVFIKKHLDVRVDWQIDAAGQLRCAIDADRELKFPALPRFGLRFFLPARYNMADYFGYGPYESYIDKHRASRLGRYSDTVAGMHEDYIKPQENGSHWGCRDVSLTDGVHALTAKAEGKPFSFNASPYTQEELMSKAHNYELCESGMTVFCLDYGQSGIGSNSCGPMLLEKYRLDEEHISFRFSLQMD